MPPYATRVPSRKHVGLPGDFTNSLGAACHLVRPHPLPPFRFANLAFGSAATVAPSRVMARKMGSTHTGFSWTVTDGGHRYMVGKGAVQDAHAWADLDGD